jgi:chemotaxis protein CheD
MPLVTVGVSDLKISEHDDDVLVTYALGSCIGVIVHDPLRRIGGMIHYMLPQSSVSPERAQENPAMFADTGVPLLFHGMYRMGCDKQRLVVKVVGGARIHGDGGGTFDIGRRNYSIIRQMLWKAGVLMAAECVGGAASRTARLHVGSGRVTVLSNAQEVEL